MQKLVKVHPSKMEGNTLTSAAMTAFDKKHQKDVKISNMFGTLIVSIFNKGSWVDYDSYKEGELFVFLLAQ